MRQRRGPALAIEDPTCEHDDVAAVSRPDAHALLAPLVGSTITTITGRPNEVLRLNGDTVLVGTGRSPRGTAVPLATVQRALDALFADGEVTVSVATLGHRSSFVAAVLLTLPATTLK